MKSVQYFGDFIIRYYEYSTDQYTSFIDSATISTFLIIRFSNKIASPSPPGFRSYQQSFFHLKKQNQSRILSGLIFSKFFCYLCRPFDETRQKSGGGGGGKGEILRFCRDRKRKKDTRRRPADVRAVRGILHCVLHYASVIWDKCGTNYVKLRSVANGCNVRVVRLR